MAERLAVFRERHDALPLGRRQRAARLRRDGRRAARASRSIPTCAAGVIFFNNVGYLGMCGHGTIGVVVDARPPGPDRRRGRIGSRRPSASSRSRSTAPNDVSVENVPSYRSATGVAVDVPGLGRFTGDVAWGGNWFFLVERSRRDARAGERRAADRRHLADPPGARRQGITGADGGEIDHIELFGPPHAPGADSRNFVLCPGKAYDRSPCGTGTSASSPAWLPTASCARARSGGRRASSAASSRARTRVSGERILPHIRGAAFVNAEATLLLDPADPFRFGIRA